MQGPHPHTGIHPGWALLAGCHGVLGWMDPYLFRRHCCTWCSVPLPHRGIHPGLPLSAARLGMLRVWAGNQWILTCSGDCCTWCRDPTHIQVSVQVEPLGRVPWGAGVNGFFTCSGEIVCIVYMHVVYSAHVEVPVQVQPLGSSPWYPCGYCLGGGKWILYCSGRLVVHDARDSAHVEVPIQVQPLGGAPGGAGWMDPYLFREIVVHDTRDPPTQRYPSKSSLSAGRLGCLRVLGGKWILTCSGRLLYMMRGTPPT